MNKMVINNLEKLFVTNDAATILRQLEVGIYFCEMSNCCLFTSFAVNIDAPFHYRSSTQLLKCW